MLASNPNKISAGISIPSQLEVTPSQNPYQSLYNVMDKYFDETTLSELVKTLNSLKNHFIESPESEEYGQKYLGKILYETSLAMNFIVELKEEFDSIKNK